MCDCLKITFGFHFWAFISMLSHICLINGLFFTSRLIIGNLELWCNSLMRGSQEIASLYFSSVVDSITKWKIITLIRGEKINKLTNFYISFFYFILHRPLSINKSTFIVFVKKMKLIRYLFQRKGHHHKYRCKLIDVACTLFK